MTTANSLKTFLLLACMTGLFVAIGGAVGGQQGMIIAFVIAAGMNLFALWNSDSMVLRMYNAQPVSADSHPGYYGLVAELARRAELPMPKVYLIDEAQPNAFATGRSPENAAVAATTGLIRMLDEREVAGVIAHELAHIKHRDTLTMTVTATLAGAIGMLASFGGMFSSSQDSRNNPLGPLGAIVLMIVGPLAAMLVQMAISRSREYEADRLGAEIAGNPLWLASALHKISRGAEQIDNNRAEANPATAHMFIVNPLHAHAVDGLFRTHPRTEDRIRRLQAMASAGDDSPPPAAPERRTVGGRGSVPNSGRSRPRQGPWR